MSTRLLALTVIVCTFAACADYEPAESARQDLIRNLIIRDNFDIAFRDPDLVAGKYLKMAGAEYSFFRGTYGLFLYDQTVGEGALPTNYGSAGSTLVQILGDPHPENIGTYNTANRDLVVDFNDFDAAFFGSYILDVRRLALGFTLVAREAGLEEHEAIEFARAVAKGYARALPTEGKRPMAAMSAPESVSKILKKLVEDSKEDGLAQKQLEKLTVVRDGQHYMAVEPREMHELGFVEKEIFIVDEQERSFVEELVGDYWRSLQGKKTPAFFAVKGVSRRIGSGVSSYALRRYYVLVEGPTDGLSDDVLLEMREVRDAPQVDPRLIGFPRQPFQSNGERIVTLKRRAQATALNDEFAGWVDLGAHSFKVRHRSGYQDGIDVAKISKKIRKGSWDEDDLAIAAAWTGGLLAQSHARAPTRDGRDALLVIAEAMGNGENASAGFVEETVDWTEAYLPIVESDLQLFREAIELYGPLLGARSK